jgi:tetratricopeptide (TPR) repeat protein
MHERALYIDETNLGPDNAKTLATRTNLADAYRSAGQVEKAVALFEAILADSERMFGLDHRDTLDLASQRRLCLPRSGAFGLFHRAIRGGPHRCSAGTQRRPPRHPDRPHNLADAYRSAGHVDHAIAMYETVLADRLRVLGPEHPNTLATRNGLAVAFSLRAKRPEPSHCLRPP